jgi:DNA-binding NarL/FixJ family response regulator
MEAVWIAHILLVSPEKIISCEGSDVMEANGGVLAMDTSCEAQTLRPIAFVVDQRRFRQAGFARLFEVWADEMGMELVAVSPAALHQHAQHNPGCKLVLLSVGANFLGTAEQQELMHAVHTLTPDAKLVVLSDRDEAEEVCGAFAAGASGFLPTSVEPALALQALSFIMEGGSFFPPYALSHPCFAGERECGVADGRMGTLPRSDALTDRQRSVITLLRQGKSNKHIARELDISEATVKVHVRQIMRKFGVMNRTQVAISAICGDGMLQRNQEADGDPFSRKGDSDSQARRHTH